MEETKTISSAVAQNSLAMDESRVDEQSAHTYYHTFWDAYKGHVRGMLTGIAIEGVMGMAVGLALCCIPAIGFGMALPLMAICGSGGAFLGAELFGSIGGATASRASGLAERHARLLDPAFGGDLIQATDDKLMDDGRGHHYEFPASRDRGKIFSWKSGGVGALIGGLLGGAAVYTSMFSELIPFLHIASTSGTLAMYLGSAGLVTATITAPALITAGTILAGAFVFGLIGATFGIDRSLFKSIFDMTDANILGATRRHKGLDQGRLQTASTESDYALYQHRLRRQEEMNVLGKKYYSKIFWSGVAGAFRGIVGGIVLGALIGVAVGVLAYGGVALFAASALAEMGGGLAAFVSMIGGFTALGAGLGMNVYSTAGMEAGCESAARAIDNEFVRNRELQQKGINPAPAPAKHESLFNIKTFAIMAVLGALCGVALTTVVSTAIAGHLALSVAPMLISAVAGSVTGAAFGVGIPVWRGIGNLTDKLYETSYFRQGDPVADKTHIVVKTPEADLRPVRTTAVTKDDMARLDARLPKPQDKYFEQAILNRSATPATPTVG